MRELSLIPPGFRLKALDREERATQGDGWGGDQPQRGLRLSPKRIVHPIRPDVCVKEPEVRLQTSSSGDAPRGGRCIP